MSINAKTIGILAHVDAGKTTLSEQLLFKTGAIRSVGRVDRGDTILDSNQIERDRGITVFSDQADFTYAGKRYTLIDTPGHVDFAAETERVLSALDAAILLADASDGIRPHTILLYNLARSHHVPVILFLNKCDLPAANIPMVLRQIRNRLKAVPIPLPANPESVAELDESFLEKYLEEQWSEADLNSALQRTFLEGDCIPVLSGSALCGQGVEALLDAMNQLIPDKSADNDALNGVVYKIRRDAKGQRMAFVKLFSGMLKPRDAFAFGDQIEKISEIRRIFGNRYESVDTALSGDAIAITGVMHLQSGNRICMQNGKLTAVEGSQSAIQSTLSAKVEPTDGTSESVLREKLSILDDEDPQLKLQFNPTTQETLVRVMGPIQLEVLENVLLTRFGIHAEFSPPQVIYMETIAQPVLGCGHFEPLRHYAEVILRLEPAERGSGITFESECHVDTLPIQYQKLIRTHVFERVHRGKLVGAELTDVKIVLLNGRAHEKHTEGGDFREATYRAIRHGVMQSQSILLEPYYRMEIIVPAEYAGKITSEIQALGGEAQPVELSENDARICAVGPVAKFADYGVTLRSETRGQGGATFSFCGYDICHNAQAVIAERGYQPDADLEQPAGSMFCAHGAAVFVPWTEAENRMHCLKK